jgi:putative tricarboxylic transport membrane protein
MILKSSQDESKAVASAEALVWLMLAIIAAAGLWFASGWPMGTLGRPGPGAFASGILTLLEVVASVNLVSSLRAFRLVHAQSSAAADRSVWLLLLAPVFFAVFVEPTGFLIASCLSVGVAAKAAGERFVRAMLIALVLSIAVFLLFRFGLSVPLNWGSGILKSLGVR